MGRMHTQRTEELMREAEQPPELMAAKLASQVRLSPPISAQSRLQSRPNLACNLASQDDPLSLMIGGGPDYSKRENGFDGFRHAPPHVLSQSCSFAAPVEALAVTQTVQGITPKYVL